MDVVVLHGYIPSQIRGQGYGKPLNAPFGNGNILSFDEKFRNSPINVGSFAFAGNLLAFHILDGKLFTLTYTLDAMVKSPNI